ncbi:amino acid/polyamine/organocation transporter (APC superfamily) [Neobacillus bataviensis]|uniref:Amino acid/polyamine/organocation transporter (APC superfamily) n=1 Tax=Neobacillus bataviensis TaxID=220685 RepID=A0A561CYU5_9BACI|nr:APC family permease [Neobacillus bataviensis]TWD96403.1 amino acid/polyamine/organocation transporter (APC superfamily) [Neobacillus bataviensis]
MTFKRLLFGRPLKSSEVDAEKMPIWKALPILSSDALSSVAYGTEMILLELATVGAFAFSFSLPIAIAIILLISILIVSYRQVIDAYPQGGGAYMVAKENLSMMWGRLAGVSLLIDYTLTVAVSISAGVLAITSAFPAGLPYIVPIGIIFIWFMVWMNLRGTSESGNVFALPTYLFIVCMLILVGKGLFDWLTNNVQAEHHVSIPTAIPSGLTWFVLLKAFSSGCSAVTGVEAISNAVPNFRDPAQRSAKRTMLTLGVLLAVIFGGVTILSQAYDIHPDSTGTKTVLSMVAEDAFGRGVIYYIIQIATMMILTLAANTSFNGFPILASIMAQDNNMPRMFSNRGDRLAFNHGIITLGVLASILLIVFGGRTESLIPLYAIGVFLSFTMAQVGLVIKWCKEKSQGWKRKAIINGIGALVTFFVVIIFSLTKFEEGAWIVVFITPILLWVITKINKHYKNVAKQLNVDLAVPIPTTDTVIIIPVAGIHKVVVSTIGYAKALTPNVVAFYVAFSPEAAKEMEDKWAQWNPGVRLVVVVSRYRTVIKPLIEFIGRIEYHLGEKKRVTVLLPEFFTSKWWHRLLHNQSAFRIRATLFARKDVVVATVPFRLND